MMCLAISDTVSAMHWPGTGEERKMVKRLELRTDCRLLRHRADVERLKKMIEIQVEAHNRRSKLQMRVVERDKEIFYLGHKFNDHAIDVVCGEPRCWLFSCHLRPVEGFMFNKQEEGGAL